MRAFIIIIGVGLVLITVSSCEEWYCCRDYYNNYNCVKGTDTIQLEVLTLGNNVNDSLNYYSNKGFTCTYYIAVPSEENCVRGQMQKKSAEKQGFSCDQTACAQGICGE